MCGIAGFYNPAGFHSGWAEQCAGAMATVIAHRGPDDSGEWIDGEAGIALSHCRLSILDLSPAGHQPMVSASGRYVLIFNGEIYNHMELRAELVNQLWRGHSDTETLLAAIERWGLEPSLRKSVGMFALGLWDRHTRVLTLARDRMGEKPLYYGWQGCTFLFGSELKALRCHPEFRREIDRNAISLFLSYGYIPAPHSIYQGIHKLIPGTILRMSDFAQRWSLPQPEPYWSLTEAVVAGQADPFRSSEDDAILELETRLSEAICHQMVADVPLGAFLSGGIDSSTVVALMQAQSTRPVKTFTIGFVEQGYNEAEHAKKVAKHLGTEHTELYVTSREAMDVIAKLPMLYDEPFGDASAIPTFLVSQLARQHVTVSLSGDGGDELFGGYGHYFQYPLLWQRLNRLPTFVWRNIAALAAIAPVKLMNALGEPLLALRGRAATIPIGVRLRQVASAMSYGSDDDFVQAMRAELIGVGEVIAKNGEASGSVDRGDGHPGPLPSAHLSERMMHHDAMRYLPDDILVKVDRAAMSVSLETRVPLLDHRVVEFAARLPLGLKIRNGSGKWVLRQVLYRHVPQALVERPKKGFGVPTDSWVREGQVRQWAEALLDRQRLNQEGFLKPDVIQSRWKEHLSGRYNWQGMLWRILMFQAWLSEQHR